MTTGEKIAIGFLIIVIIGLVVFGVLKATAPEMIQKSGTGGSGTGGSGTGGTGGTGGSGTGGTGTTPLISDNDIIDLADKFHYEFFEAWTSSNRCTVVNEVFSLSDADLLRFRNKYISKFGQSPQNVLENAYIVCLFSNEDDLLINRFIAIQNL